MVGLVTRSGRQPSLDRLFELLADRRCRYTLYYLEEVTSPVVTLDELADQLVVWEREWDNYESSVDDDHRENVCIDLHHNQLPRLADEALIDYDARTQTIRNWGEPSLVEWAQDDMDEIPRLRALLTAPEA